MNEHAPFPVVRTGIALVLALGISLVVYRQATIDRGVEYGKIAEIAEIGRDSPGYLALAAERDFAARDSAEALAKSQRALLAAPANPVALRVYALAKNALGDPGAAGQAMSLAGLWGWRDPITQFWLMNESGKRADLSNMFVHADALLRTDGPNSRIFSLLASAMSMRGGIAELSGRLADQPGWRKAFFDYLGAAGLAHASSIVPLAAQMRATSPLTSGEAAPAVNALIAADRPQDGYAIWRQAVAARGYVVGNAVYDPGFELHADNVNMIARFDWTLMSVPGLDIGVRQAPARTGKALYVRFDGEEGRPLIRQDLMLRPGSHTLRVAVLRDGNGAPARWKVSCGDAVKLELSGASTGQTNRWTEESYSFAVPPGCMRQILELDGLASDGESGGTTWIDDVSISS